MSAAALVEGAETSTGINVGITASDIKRAVFADLDKLDLWPTVYVSNRMEELPLHWHDVDNHGYVLEGKSYLLDENGERVPIGPGDKFVASKLGPDAVVVVNKCDGDLVPAARRIKSEYTSALKYMRRRSPLWKPRDDIQ